MNPGPEEIKYKNWVEEQFKKGLVDIKYEFNELTSIELREEFFKELNSMNEAEFEDLKGI